VCLLQELCQLAGCSYYGSWKYFSICGFFFFLSLFLATYTKAQINTTNPLVYDNNPLHLGCNPGTIFFFILPLSFCLVVLRPPLNTIPALNKPNRPPSYK